MFIGHLGAGMAAKKIESSPSLGTYFLAAQFIDLLWPVFLLLGIEHVVVQPGVTEFTPLNFVYYPFSHSLFAVLIWGVLFALIYFFLKRNFKASLLLGILVLSHWILDFITHIPDLPIFPWSEIKVGLGLWNSIPLTIIVEGIFFLLGVILYSSAAKSKNKTGIYAYWSLLIFLVVIYISNIAGPPPPDEQTIGFVGLSQWLLVAWAYWIDRNRVTSNQNKTFTEG